MMATLKASEEGLNRIDKLRRKKGWNKQDNTWVRLAKSNKAALKKFWRRMPINHEHFKDICTEVGANWEEIIESKNNNPQFSQYDQAWVGRNALIFTLT